jgi:hypothetical protein
LAALLELGDTNYAVKFENGHLPPGFDGSGGRTAAIVGICAALSGVLIPRRARANSGRRPACCPQTRALAGMGGETVSGRTSAPA